MKANPAPEQTCRCRLIPALVLAAAALGWSAPAASQTLGRLFFTEQQRSDLDRRRQANERDAAPVVESYVTVNGQVTRSSGKTTVWLNGVPRADTGRPRDPSRVTLRGAGGERSISIKIGQTLDQLRGEVKDPLAGGKVLAPAHPERPGR